MKQGYYLYTDNLRGNSLTNKITMQNKAFNMELSVSECPLITINKSIFRRVTNILPFCSYERDYKSAIKSFAAPDFIYIRMFYVDKQYVSFLASVKEQFPYCKIIVEIPTYPYKKEMCSSLYGKFMYFKDILYRKQYRRYIDRFVTYSYDDVINGVSTIQTMNGVDVDSYNPVTSSRQYNPKCINMIAVGFFMRHHGYERLIEGLRNYYKDKRDRIVIINIIGDGKEKKKYERLVRKCKLTDYVRISRPMYDKDLDRMYDKADVGLSSFGSYKDGVIQVGALKTREYLAKGIPVVLGTEDRLFSNHGYEYGLLFPNNDSPIDIERVLSFLDGVYLNRERKDVIDSIRQFAKRTVDNTITLAPIIDYINNDY